MSGVVIPRPLDWIQLKLDASLNNLSINEDLITDLVLGGNLAHNISTGVTSLIGGRTYRLDAHIHLDSFSDATGGNLQLMWADDSDDSNLYADFFAMYTPATHTTARGANNSLSMIYKALADIDVKIRCSSSTGDARANADRSHVLIYELATTLA